MEGDKYRNQCLFFVAANVKQKVFNNQLLLPLPCFIPGTFGRKKSAPIL